MGFDRSERGLTSGFIERVLGPDDATPLEPGQEYYLPVVRRHCSSTTLVEEAAP